MLKKKYGSFNVFIENINLRSQFKPNLHLSGLINYFTEGGLMKPVFMDLEDFENYRNAVWHTAHNSQFMEIVFGVISDATDTFSQIPEEFRNKIKYLKARIDYNSEEKNFDKNIYLTPAFVGADYLDETRLNDEWGRKHLSSVTDYWGEELEKIVSKKDQSILFK